MAAVVASAATAYFLTSARKPLVRKGRPKKVLVAGAGPSGLAAAYELTQVGHDVTVLEARARPGGRVYTVGEPFADGLYAEAGAARIPPDHDLTLEYIQRFNLALDPVYPTGLSYVSLIGDKWSTRDWDGYATDARRAVGMGLGGDSGQWLKIRGGMDLLPQSVCQAASRQGDL
ncbi:MAG: FAD-dependent oxidoreductase [candidate division Zixibacteria bacterium]|nr:FAD-dependent oxidoreductase [candidate division Zixibacteria bacterium]